MLKWSYGTLAIFGAIVPWIFNVQFAQQSGGLDAGAFIGACFANPAASSISVDILIGATAFLVWMFTEARRLGMRRPWAYVVLTVLVAFAFAAPLFLFMRERQLAHGGQAAD